MVPIAHVCNIHETRVFHVSHECDMLHRIWSSRDRDRPRDPKIARQTSDLTRPSAHPEIQGSWDIPCFACVATGDPVKGPQAPSQG